MQWALQAGEKAVEAVGTISTVHDIAEKAYHEAKADYIKVKDFVEHLTTGRASTKMVYGAKRKSYGGMVPNPRHVKSQRRAVRSRRAGQKQRYVRASARRVVPRLPAGFASGPLPAVLETEMISSCCDVQAGGLTDLHHLKIRLNDIHEPFAGGFSGATQTARQPRGSDELFGMYSKAVVTNAKLEVNLALSSHAGTAGGGYVVCYGLSHLVSPAELANIPDALEQKSFGYKVVRGAATSSDWSNTSVNYAISPLKYMRAQWDDDGVYTTASASPTNVDNCFFHLLINEMPGHLANGTMTSKPAMYVMIRLVQRIKFYEPKILADS